MTPIRFYSDWNTRPGDRLEKIEPYRKYFIIAEGRNTERWYFSRLIDHRRALGIHHLIDIIFCERTGVDEGSSNPEQLLALAEKHRNTADFDRDHDKMIVIFDADIYEREGAHATGLAEIIESGGTDNILGVTNPSFELFLLLHYQGTYEADIAPNENAIVANLKTGNQRYITTLFVKRSGMNPKTNKNIANLADHVFIAIEQEKKINRDVKAIHGKVTSNIGQIIQSMIDDNPPR